MPTAMTNILAFVALNFNPLSPAVLDPASVSAQSTTVHPYSVSKVSIVKK